MKGQFFIIGALFVSVLLFMGMSPYVGITRTGTDDIERLGSNLAKEFPHALNIGINSSDAIGTLFNFTDFSISAAGKRRIETTCYWLVFRPGSSGLNVSAGNFMGGPLSFLIDVGGTVKALDVGTSSVNSTTFSVGSDSYNASVTLDGETSSFTLLTNKANIIGVITLDRAGNVISKEILA